MGSRRKKRVLKDGLKFREQSLLLLYSSGDSTVLLEDLCAWVEYASVPLFKRDVIRKLHRTRLLEFDEESCTVVLSPKGAAYVEENLLE